MGAMWLVLGVPLADRVRIQNRPTLIYLFFYALNWIPATTEEWLAFLPGAWNGY